MIHLAPKKLSPTQALALSPGYEPIMKGMLYNKSMGSLIPPASPSFSKHSDKFIKQKSINRYLISNKGGLQLPQKEANYRRNPPEPAQNSENAKTLGGLFSIEKLDNSKSNQQGGRQMVVNKQKYFKRKTRAQFYGIRSEESLNPQFSTEAQPLASSSENEIASLKTTNAILLRENKSLKRKLQEKEERIESLLAAIQLKQKAHQLKLQQEIEANIKKQTELISQIQVKHLRINLLETGYKYIEIENNVLKNAKSKCCQQRSFIEQLQKQKKILQEKVKMLCWLRSKKKKRSECDISLTLSVEGEKQELDEPSSPPKAEPQMKDTHLANKR